MRPARAGRNVGGIDIGCGLEFGFAPEQLGLKSHKSIPPRSRFNPRPVQSHRAHSCGSAAESTMESIPVSPISPREAFIGSARVNLNHRLPSMLSTPKLPRRFLFARTEPELLMLRPRLRQP